MTEFLAISLERVPEEGASLSSPSPCESQPSWEVWGQCSFFALRVRPEPRHPPPQAICPALPSLPVVSMKVDLASAPCHLCSFWDRHILSAITENANARPARHKHPPSQGATRDSCGLRVCCRVIMGTVENSKLRKGFAVDICHFCLLTVLHHSSEHPVSLLDKPILCRVGGGR